MIFSRFLGNLPLDASSHMGEPGLPGDVASNQIRRPFYVIPTSGPGLGQVTACPAKSSEHVRYIPNSVHQGAPQLFPKFVVRIWPKSQPKIVAVPPSESQASLLRIAEVAVCFPDRARDC
jgi:hypothetical protein